MKWFIFIFALLAVTSHCEEDVSGRSHKYAGPLAAADRIVEAFYEEYPHLGKYDENEAQEFKQEVVTLREDEDDYYDALMKSPSAYPIFTAKLEKLRKYATSKASNYATMVKEMKDIEKTNRFLMFLIVNKPIIELERTWKEYSEKRGLDEEEIFNQNEDNEDEAHEVIYNKKESVWARKRREDL
ncbi:hypothetical protein PFISCL1PPCAC_19023 [Pristionchus fissidentatus]|uniref:SXP/RAL-2 family protein Ani s 5-like cation-binding domain-containing protein n=1 Tax=Pristionchus fissidentatus TaxID=1538716 RepID=A0AAV5WA82_9BILA|nr:hypothetical protein PFISCL1PPCAC_19023 [Pristionchus fissidentatus]